MNWQGFCREMGNMQTLELFAGSCSFSKVAQSLGYSTLTVDIKQHGQIDLVADVAELSPDKINFIPDIIWASPDCTTYSLLACAHHRYTDGSPRSEKAEEADEVLAHLIQLIGEFMLINPAMVYYIENPRALMRTSNIMLEHLNPTGDIFTEKTAKNVLKMGIKTIWYCQYGDTRAKPTDIFTNDHRWLPRAECYNSNNKCHHEKVKSGEESGTKRLKNSYERSKIPSALFYELMNNIHYS